MYYLVCLLLVFPIVSINTFSQSVFNSLRQSEKVECAKRLDAKIKSATEWKYDNYTSKSYKSQYAEYDINGIQTKLVKFTVDGGLISRESFIYDSLSNRSQTSVCTYKSSDDSTEDKQTISYVWEDSKNIFIETAKNQSGDIVKTATKYFSKGKKGDYNIIKSVEIVYEPVKNETRSYYNKLSLRTNDSTFIDNNLVTVKNCEYDKKGNLIKENEKVIKDNVIKTYAYVYNTMNLISEKRLLNKKDIAWKWAYTYDKVGNLYKIVEYDYKNTPKKFTRINYEYYIDPDAFSYDQEGFIWLKSGNLDRGYESVNKSLQIWPGYFSAHGNLGTYYSLTNNYIKAIEENKKALEYNPNHTTSMYNLACIFSLKNDIKESKSWLESALQSGYSDFDQIKRDKDLTNLKKTKEFCDMVKNYNSRYYEKEFDEFYNLFSSIDKQANEAKDNYNTILERNADYVLIQSSPQYSSIYNSGVVYQHLCKKTSDWYNQLQIPSIFPKDVYDLMNEAKNIMSNAYLVKSQEMYYRLEFMSSHDYDNNGKAESLSNEHLKQILLGAKTLVKAKMGLGLSL